MHEVKISAALPYPLRVNPSPYQVEYRESTWRLTFERVQRTTPDERIAAPGSTVDLAEDREGQLAYSRVRAEATLDSNEGSAMGSFLGALNLFIDHVRDLLSLYWIRPLRVEDLYQVVVEIDGVARASWHAGRAGAMTLAVSGLTDSANAKLETSLWRGQAPPTWRQMQLDARDALSLGRYEDCAVLAWSALEAACRQTLPGLAYRAGWTPTALAQRLDAPRRIQEPPDALEDAVRRVSNGLRVLETAAELTEPIIWSPTSVADSVRLAFDLRNRIVHQGVRLNRGDAQRVWESVDFVLGQALSLRNVPRPPRTNSWRNRFQRVFPDVERFTASNELTIVVAYPEKDSLFRMELLGEELWFRIPVDMKQREAATLLYVQWEARRRGRLHGRPYLTADGGGLLLQGLVEVVADVVESAVCFGEALISAGRANRAVAKLARRGAAYFIDWIGAEPQLDPNDARLVIVPAQIARYLAALSPRSRGLCLTPLLQTQPEVARMARRWADAIAAMDPDDEHGACTVLRIVHNDSPWLDSIRVACPIERLVFGSGCQPLG